MVGTSNFYRFLSHGHWKLVSPTPQTRRVPPGLRTPHDERWRLIPDDFWVSLPRKSVVKWWSFIWWFSQPLWYTVNIWIIYGYIYIYQGSWIIWFINDISGWWLSYLALWKNDGVRHLGWHSQYSWKNHPFMFQTTNQSATGRNIERTKGIYRSVSPL